MTEITQDISQIALEFCREVLGWEDARYYAADKEVHEEHIYSSSARAAFLYASLEPVMKAVEKWWLGLNPDNSIELLISKKGCRALLFHSQATDKFYGGIREYWSQHKNKCATLMLAALEAKVMKNTCGS
ncbi:MAG: hypothetical protein EPO08_20845 [Rhodospirillaceae bacterium]|nr:MAG: hypothetical protein EPO08_20845 [Rhodospirillaceae bacterium]